MVEDRSATRRAHRSLAFAERPGPRYDWHRQPGSDYVPPLYATLSDEEWALLEAWYDATDEKAYAGEANVTFMSFVQGLVMGNQVRRVAQLGTYAGYSTLLLGFMLRRMGVREGLYTLDIALETNHFTREWVERAGLGGHVSVCTGDSADPRAVAEALEYLGGPPQLLVIDSSHQYRHTLQELDLWFPALPSGGMIVMHDASAFAEMTDATGEGGVRRALDEWTASMGDAVTCASLGLPSDDSPPVYLDPCGLALLQKR